jgi:phage gp36-like protein
MSYFTRTALETIIPPAFLVEALDDDGDGVEDTGLYSALAAEAEAAVDEFLSRRYAVPMDPAPAMVANAAKIFAAEMLHQRRGQYGDKNPFTARANAHRTTLEMIATGDITFGPATAPAKSPISIITEPAGTVPASRING